MISIKILIDFFAEINKPIYMKMQRAQNIQNIPEKRTKLKDSHFLVSKFTQRIVTRWTLIFNSH